MRQFRSAKQSMRLMDVLPPEQGERLKPALRPAFSREIIDAEFEIVADNADYRRYPTYNDNRKTGLQKHTPALQRLTHLFARTLRHMENLLQRVSGRSFAALTFTVFALVFIAIQTFSASGIETAPAAMPVEPLAIEHVEMRLKVKNGLPMLTLSGDIVNRSQTRIMVPDVTVTMAEGANADHDLTIEPPVTSLGPGQSTYFSGQFRHVGGKLPKLTLAFAKP